MVSKIRKKFQSGKFAVTVITALLCMIIFTGCNLFQANDHEVIPEDYVEQASMEAPSIEEVIVSIEETEKETENEKVTETEKETEKEEVVEPRVIKICAIGDMLMHTGVSGLAFKQDGSINYDFIFEPIQKEIKEADISIVNNEVPFGGDHIGLQNYPAFNVYSALGDSEVKAGFDVILNATNHVMDQGTSGLVNTINFWKKYPEMTILGVHETREDLDQIKIVEIDGFKIAMFNYAYGINSGGLSEDKSYMIDLMQDPYREKIAKELRRAEEEADFTIVFPHWGEEYHLRETGKQREWAQFFTECGADLIIGTHPHCLEPVKEVVSENGNTSICFYSLGNYISMQDEMISILGGLANIELLADENGIKVQKYSVAPLVTYYNSNYEYAYVTKLEDFTQNMMDTHCIKTNHLPGNGFNNYYPPTINTFYRVLDEVNGIKPLSVDPGTAQNAYFSDLREKEKEESEEDSSSTEDDESEESGSSDETEVNESSETTSTEETAASEETGSEPPVETVSKEETQTAPVEEASIDE